MLDYKVCKSFGSSDHLSVNIQLYFSNIVFAKTDLYTAYDYKSVNRDAINHDLNCTNWFNLYTYCMNSNVFWNCFSNHVIYLCDLYIPCSIMCTNNKRYHPGNIRKLLVKIKRLWQLHRRFKINNTLLTFKVCFAECRREINSNIRSIELKLTDGNNLGIFHRYVNKKLVTN